MAITYTYTDALNMIQTNVLRQCTDAHAAILCNIAVNKIWNRYDWRESIVQLPPFYLIPLAQDFGSPATSVPADLYGLREVYWLRRTVIPPYREPISVYRDLPLTHVRGLPNSISYEVSNKCFRVFPRVPDNIGASDYMVDGTYKKRPNKVTADIMAATPLIWDDVYLNTFIETLKWAAFSTSGDPRAGETKLEAGHVAYTGQMAIMYDSIDNMAVHEGQNLGNTMAVPSEPLCAPAGIFTGAIVGFGI